ncbi:hypothetical protein [Bradyrhizobium sp. DOA9]|uniref:hypothetical protein n=1 Tax=Bradyrhizobium sp. DOA9 TaxID=1126627 RepID=UPI00049987F0|nr:hypothetical protein [Bradyrhizobium sp. DOA9]GAJ37717.1 probable peptidase Y4NA [Bradyrhizobium sp. DOA9]
MKKPRVGKPTLPEPDDDPYLWLEEREGRRALRFVARQNTKTLEAFCGAAFTRDRARLRMAYDRYELIPRFIRAGAFIYHLFTNADNPRGLLRRTTLAEFKSAQPSWDSLIDIDQLAASEGQDWLLSWIAVLPAGARMILALSAAGREAVTLREFDLTNRNIDPRGFYLPKAISDIAWLGPDEVLLSSTFGTNMTSTAGHA